MTYPRLLVVAILIAALLLVLPAPRAAAEPRPPLPDMPRLTSYPCTPYGKYCFNGRKWREKGTIALDWSDRHYRSSARHPVPYPLPTTWNLNRYYHVVYVVQYGSKRHPQVYKYGLTRHVPWTHRPQKGVRKCQREKAERFTNCRYTWVAVVNAAHGLYWARYLEASMIKDYESRYWKCPPGQEGSCR